MKQPGLEISTRKQLVFPHWFRLELPYRPTREARTAAYLMVVLTVGAYLPTPLYPAYQRQFEFSDFSLTLIYAIYPLVCGVALLLFGPASDTLGRRVVLRLGILAGALGSVSFLIADGFGWLIAGRVFQGIALGAATGAATALIVERAPAGRGQWASVLATVAFLGGTALGPVASGVLAEYAPASNVTPYALQLVLLAIGWRRACALSSVISANGALQGRRLTLLRIPAAIRPQFLVTAGVGFLAWAVVGLFLSAVPLVLERAAGITSVAMTGVILAALLVFAMVVQPLLLYMDARLAQRIGLAGLLVSLAVLTLTGGQSLPMMLAVAVVAGCGVGLAYGGAASEVDEIASGEQRGGVNAAAYLSYYLGSGLPAIVLGILSVQVGMSTSLTWLAALTAVCTVAVGVVVWHVPRSPGGETATAALAQ